MAFHGLAYYFAKAEAEREERLGYALRKLNKYPTIISEIEKFVDNLDINHGKKEAWFENICMLIIKLMHIQKLDPAWIMRDCAFVFREKCTPFILKTIVDYQSLCEHEYGVNWGNNSCCLKCYQWKSDEEYNRFFSNEKNLFFSHTREKNKLSKPTDNAVESTSCKYRKIPIFIMKWNDGAKGWRAEIADNYENYKPAKYDDINFEDLGFHFRHDIETHPDDDLVFLTRKNAVKCAKFCNEKYLGGKAKIWFST